MERQNILHYEKELALSQSLNVNQLGEYEGQAPQEFSKLRFSEIAGNMHFSIYFCIFKVVKEANKAT